jgi:beta-glucosidase
VTDLAVSLAFADELVAEMTLAEKAAQMTQVEHNAVTPDEVAEFAIGSVLSGGGSNPDPNTAASWAAMVGSYLDGARRSRLGIPLLYGTDAVHGHNNVVGATIFPHNVGLGATGDAALVERVYRAAALETAATGVRWAFAPTVAVSIDPRWGRSYESFGDDPGLVSELGVAAVRGWQGAGGEGAVVLACPKHYVGDGGTTWGTARRVPWNEWWDGWGTQWQIDQGDTRLDEVTMRSVHLLPYEGAVAAGALSVMASYSSWNGVKLHGHRRLLTDVLKGELGFEGLVVSDWMGIDQLDPDPYRCAVVAIGVGVDMVMVPFEFRRFIDDVVAAVERGDLDSGRVDDAVRRIVAVKHALGLFGDLTTPAIGVVGCAEHRALAAEAAAASAVLLRHAGNVLPITGGPVLVAGAGADDVGLQCGGWTIEWQGGIGPITPGTTILEGLRAAAPSVDFAYDAAGAFGDTMAPVGIVVVAEQPYAEGLGDRADLALPAADIDLVEGMRARVDKLVLVVVSGRPIVVDRVADHCDAIVAAWLPGSEASGVAEVLVGARPFRGRLPRRWPAETSQVDDPTGSWRAAWERGHGMTL